MALYGHPIGAGWPSTRRRRRAPAQLAAVRRKPLCSRAPDPRQRRRSAALTRQHSPPREGNTHARRNQKKQQEYNAEVPNRPVHINKTWSLPHARKARPLSPFPFSNRYASHRESEHTTRLRENGDRQPTDLPVQPHQTAVVPVGGSAL